MRTGVRSSRPSGPAIAVSGRRRRSAPTARSRRSRSASTSSRSIVVRRRRGPPRSGPGTSCGGRCPARQSVDAHGPVGVACSVSRTSELRSVVRAGSLRRNGREQGSDRAPRCPSRAAKQAPRRSAACTTNRSSRHVRRAPPCGGHRGGRSPRAVSTRRARFTHPNRDAAAARCGRRGCSSRRAPDGSGGTRRN